MLVKTLKRHRYNGVLREEGSEYDIPGKKHLRLLEAVGRVRRVPEVVFAPPQEAPEPAKKKSASKKESTSKKKSSAKKKGTYKNKNMVSE